MDLSFLTGDTKMTRNQQRGLALLGAFATRVAQAASPTDDTPGVVTGAEKLEILGETGPEVLRTFAGN